MHEGNRLSEPFLKVFSANDKFIGMEPILQDPPSCFNLHKNSNEKHVRFAELPILYKPSSLFRSMPKEDSFSPLALSEKLEHDNIAEENDLFRPNYSDNAKNGLSKCSVCILLLTLTFLFFIVWYTISRILMIDIESQVAKQFINNLPNRSSRKGSL